MAFSNAFWVFPNCVAEIAASSEAEKAAGLCGAALWAQPVKTRFARRRVRQAVFILQRVSEAFKQVEAIARAGAGFGVMLDAEYRFAFDF